MRKRQASSLSFCLPKTEKGYIDKTERVCYNENATQINMTNQLGMRFALEKMHSLFSRPLGLVGNLCRSNWRGVFRCAASVAHFFIF